MNPTWNIGHEVACLEIPNFVPDSLSSWSCKGAWTRITFAHTISQLEPEGRFNGKKDGTSSNSSNGSSRNSNSSSNSITYTHTSSDISGYCTCLYTNHEIGFLSPSSLSLSFLSVGNIPFVQALIDLEGHPTMKAARLFLGIFCLLRNN